jgi:hypothetical protein
VKESAAAIENLIDRTIKLWHARVEHDLTREDARQIIENVSGFFFLLREWSRTSMVRPANDNPQPLGEGAI